MPRQSRLIGENPGQVRFPALQQGQANALVQKLDGCGVLSIEIKQ